MVKNFVAKATFRKMRVGLLKLNSVVCLIKGKSVSEALNELTFTKRRVANLVKKNLLSAIANAENNYGMNIDNLFISEIYVGKSIVMKRWRPRARGRIGKIRKPFSYLTIIVSELKEVKKNYGTAG